MKEQWGLVVARKGREENKHGKKEVGRKEKGRSRSRKNPSNLPTHWCRVWSVLNTTWQRNKLSQFFGFNVVRGRDNLRSLVWCESTPHPNTYRSGQLPPYHHVRRLEVQHLHLLELFRSITCLCPPPLVPTPIWSNPRQIRALLKSQLWAGAPCTSCSSATQKNPSLCTPLGLV